MVEKSDDEYRDEYIKMRKEIENKERFQNFCMWSALVTVGISIIGAIFFQNQLCIAVVILAAIVLFVMILIEKAMKTWWKN